MSELILRSVIDRLIEDQETDQNNRLYGQFGRNRSKDARAAVQKNGEPLSEKPELYMTFNAVQALKYLQTVVSDPKSRTPCRDLLKDYTHKINHSLGLAGDFAERLLLHHCDSNNFIKMREKKIIYKLGTDKDWDEFVSYRHTIGAIIILHLLNRMPSLEERILRRLIRTDTSNADGGWPISDKRGEASDILCSSHAAFLFRIALKSGKYQSLSRNFELKINSATSYLITQANINGGLWRYGEEISKEPFSARTYPQLHNLLLDANSPLANEIPKKLLNYYETAEDLPYNEENARKTGIKNELQFQVRLAYMLKKASESNPNEFLEPYIKMRHRSISDYSMNEYYESYDLCCLIVMLLDRFELDKIAAATKVLHALEPLLDLVFVGKVYKVSLELYRRVKKLGLLNL